MKSRFKRLSTDKRPFLGVVIALGMSTVLTATGCGPKAFTKGEYDDPNRVELLDDKYNEADMQQMAETIVKSITTCDSVTKAAKAPTVIVEKVVNKTEEHIDTEALTDMIRTQLIKSKKVRFIDKKARGTLDEEYEYNASGRVGKDTQKKAGSQIGADFILGGNLMTNIQQVGNDKFIYYKLTMNLTHLETSAIDCSEESQIRKKYRRKSVGM